MRGNWETAEAMVITPNHRLQQQPNIMEERHPLHLSSPPVWGIADRTIVKEEPIDDKECDSGVSPDHYSCSTSPKSRRSSTVNGSLSPDSAILHDSNVVQGAKYSQFSPEGIYKNEDVPMDFTRRNSADNGSIKRGPSPVEEQKMDTSETPNKGSEEPEAGQEDMRCPLTHCSFTTRIRMKFSEHLADHYSANEMPDLTRGSPRACEHDFGDMEEPGLRVPRVNSQGKIKTFRCKQCNYTSITKLEFWDHNRGHIKCDKLLTCPKCPFVTEYKHHLEYHLRNHYGSKPFKCDKCSYSCVNKSMLNSHLKSHSNIYQYRCANCSYATKYLHSLKLHLRKYTHQPAMVLNADGTPNPLPIVDVYGTRRGPKQKNLTPKLADETSNNTRNKNSAKAAKQTVAPSQVSPIINPLNVLTSFANGNGINPLMALQYNQLYNASFPMPNPFGLNGEATEKHLEQLRQSFCAEYAKAIVNERMSIEQSRESSPVLQTTYNNNGVTQNDLPTTVANLNAQIDTIRPLTPESSPESKIIPLDLSKPDTASNNDVEMKSIQDYHKENLQKQITATASPKASGTSRRKGKAFKLNVKQDIESKKEEEHHDNTARGQLSNCPTPELKELKESTDKDANPDIVSNNEFICQFCEISFGNEVMYTVHMGYHGYKNPFTCNMCGHQCDDKVSFFLHIARSKHA